MVVTTMTRIKVDFFIPAVKTFTSSAGRDRQSFNMKNHGCKVHCSWNFLAVLARNPPSPTFIYLKCWKKSSAFHCRCHFLKQWTDINDYCLKKSTVIYPYPHCWLKIHYIHQTTIHRTDHYCRNPPLFPLLEKIQGYTLFISVAAKMPLLFIVDWKKFVIKHQQISLKKNKKRIEFAAVFVLTWAKKTQRNQEGSFSSQKRGLIHGEA